MPVPSSAPKPVRRLLRDEARDRIRAAILDGTLSPGEQLDDVALQAWLGVSRTPIRDALLMLQVEGLVEISPQSATRVAAPKDKDVEDSIQAIGGVLGAVMRIAMPNASPAAREELISLVENALRAVEKKDVQAHMDAALDIYDALIDICPNPVLLEITRSSIVPLTFRYRSVVSDRIPNWELLRSGWTRVKHGLISGDNVLAELAFEELHRLPLPDFEWDPAVWNRPV